jgi:hypothetical protein
MTRETTWTARRDSATVVIEAVSDMRYTIGMFSRDELKRCAERITDSPAFRDSIYAKLMTCLKEDPKEFGKLVSKQGDLGKEALENMIEWGFVAKGVTSDVGMEFEYVYNPIRVEYYYLDNFGIEIVSCLSRKCSKKTLSLARKGEEAEEQKKSLRWLWRQLGIYSGLQRHPE